MEIYLEEITNLIKKKISPPEFKLDSEVYGIQYGIANPNRVVKKIMLTLDLSLGAIHYAIKNKFSLIISRCGLFDEPIHTIYPELLNKLSLLARYPIIVYVLSSSFFAAAEGISDTIMESLFLKLDKIFNIRNERREFIPFGRICTPQHYPNSNNERFTLKSLLNRIKMNFDMEIIRYTGDLKSQIKKICIIGESIPNLSILKKIQKCQCDCLISGNINYSKANFTKSTGLSLIEISQYKSEIIAMKKLCNILSLEFPYDEFVLYESRDPIKIFK